MQTSIEIDYLLFNKWCFLINNFTSSKFRININAMLAIFMMPQPQNYNSGGGRPEILPLLLLECCRMKTPYDTLV